MLENLILKKSKISAPWLKTSLLNDTVVGRYLHYTILPSHLIIIALLSPLCREETCIWVQGAALYRCTGVLYRVQVYTMVTIPSSCVMDCHGCSISSAQCQVKPTFVGVWLCLGRRYCLSHKYDTTIYSFSKSHISGGIAKSPPSTPSKLSAETQTSLVAREIVLCKI